MAMYSAYFEESGSADSKEPYLVVAGCVAQIEQWRHFEREWGAALSPFGTEPFHAVNFDKGKPPFEKLGDDDKDALCQLLTGIICRRIEKSVSLAVRLDHFEAINRKYIFAEYFGYPYPSAGRSCMGRVSAWAEQYSIPDEEILYFFENGQRIKVNWNG